MTWLEKFTNFFKNLKLLNKFLIALTVVSVSALTIISIFIYIRGKELLRKNAFELLENHTDNCKETVIDYFQLTQKQLSTLAQNPSTIEALLAFDSTFYRANTILTTEEENTLNKFYEIDFLKPLKYNLLDQDSEYPLYPNSDISRLLQYKYIAANPKPVGFKYLSYEMPDKNAYDYVHDKYHSSFHKNCQEFGFEDILLLNKKGDIIYSVAKKTDFATNLATGPYRFSHLSRLLKKTLKSKDKAYIGFEDFDFYMPSYGKPVCFISAPIYPSQQKQFPKIGAIIIQLNNEHLNRILNKNQHWEEYGLGTSGEVGIIGQDFLIRNNTRKMVVDPIDYQAALLKNNVDSNQVKRIKRLNTTILLRKRKSQAIINALSGKSGRQETYDFLGGKVLDVYRPLKIFNIEWAIVTEIDSEEVFQDITTLRVQLFWVSVGVFLLIIILGYFLASSLSAPMRRIQREITMLSQGEFPDKIEKTSKDELGKIQQALNVLIDNMQSVANFAKDIGKGNFNYEFNAKSDYDILGTSLLQMRDNLRKISEDEKQRNWVNTGISIFGEILRNNSDNLQLLSEKIISELVRYLKANQGALFIWEEDLEKLKLFSTYAYDKFKYLDKAISPGEGLIGQAFIEKDTIYLKEIPDDYSDIGSGLGHASSKCILVMPVQVNGQIFGVIELAAFEYLKGYEINFVEAVCEDLATTISAIKVNAETKKLLEESQMVTEQLRKQEEEMRRSFEELIRSQDSQNKYEYSSIDFESTVIEGDAVENSESISQLNTQLKETEIQKRVKNAILRQKELLDKNATNGEEDGNPQS